MIEKGKTYERVANGIRIKIEIVDLKTNKVDFIIRGNCPADGQLRYLPMTAFLPWFDRLPEPKRKRVACG